MLAGILGSAEDFAVLAHTTVTNTGPTVVSGSADPLANVGVFDISGANATTGFSSAGNTFVGPGSNSDGPGLVNAPAAIHLGSPVAGLARNDLISAHTALASQGTATNLSGRDLGTSGTLPIDTLVQGIYSFDTSAQLNGILQLDAQGTNGGVWIFQIGTMLTTASASSVQLLNPGSNLGSDVEVYWVVGSSATLGATTAFTGNILAQSSITLNAGVTISCGRALAINGAVTLDTNIISNFCGSESSLPASVGGIKFEDLDGDGVQGGGEGTLAGVTVYADLNDNRVFEPNEPSAVTDSTGAYRIENLVAGTYTIREVPPAHYLQTFPANREGHVLTLAPGDALANVNFGNQPVEPIVINDFDDEFEVIDGAWDIYPYCPGHWMDDATTSDGGTGESRAQWVFDSLEPGFYRVSATWKANPAGATNTPYTLIGGAASETVRVNQRLSPADFPNSFVEGGRPWMDLDAGYQILGDTLTVQISNDADGVVIADGIRIERVVNPEIRVDDGAAELTVGASMVEFGAATLGGPLARTFTVVNVGSVDLDLAEPIVVPAGFTVANSFGATTLAPGQSTTFALRLDAAAVGVVGGEVRLYNSDHDESPFRFDVRGTIDTEIIDDGDDGFTTQGSWTHSAGSGYQGDVTFSASGSGNDLARWTFTGLDAGTTYRVAATWAPATNRATNAPFTVIGGTVPIALNINQRAAPDDFTEVGTTWETLAQVTLTGSTLHVELTDAANGYVIADAIRLVALTGPEITVEVDGGEVLDGETLVDFGPTLIDVPRQKLFTVHNDGALPLMLSTPTVAPDGFLVSNFGQNVLNPGQTTTFLLTMPATAPGTFSGTVSFGTNDGDENPFDFTVSGGVFATLPPSILDDGETGFSTTGPWFTANDQGHDGDVRFADLGIEASIATWNLAIPLPGDYLVSVSWTPHPNRATNAPYSVGGAPSVPVNQQLAPADFIEAGTAWQDLGVFPVAGNSLAVTLSDTASGYVIADAVRIERIGSPEIRVTWDGVSLADDTAVVDFGQLEQGDTATREFRIVNVGTEPLLLSNVVSSTGGFTSGSPGATTLAPREATTFTVEFQAANAGLSAGEVTFFSNDHDEDPFNFTVRANVSQLALVAVIDDGEAGFTSFGSWTAYGGIGRDQDLRYSAGGSGADQSQWTFDALPAAGYRVSTTWVPHSNRGTNVPYTVNGSAPVFVNQRLAPDDFTADGTAWEWLGDFLADGDELRVTLSDAANGYVIADAVRIERILTAEIDVAYDGGRILDGVTHIDLGRTTLGTPLAETFTVRNLGEHVLTLVGPVSVPAGFAASAIGQLTLEPGEATSFTITLGAATAGNYVGEVRLESDDFDEGVSTFSLAGLVTAGQTPDIIDDGDPGFGTSSGWVRYDGSGVEGDVRYAAAGKGDRVATWTFSLPMPGDYLVSASWTPHANRATNAPYRVYDGIATGAHLRSTVRVNQELTPEADQVLDGHRLQDLAVVSVTGTTLTVTMANDANQYVIADAVRIEFVRPLRADAEHADMHGQWGLHADPIREAQVTALLPEALAYWKRVGISPAQETTLQNASVQMLDLPGTMLGGAVSSGILVDPYAVTDRGDLLTAITHELGHLLGLPDLDADASPNDIMAGTLRLQPHRTAYVSGAFDRDLVFGSAIQPPFILDRALNTITNWRSFDDIPWNPLGGHRQTGRPAELRGDVGSTVAETARDRGRGPNARRDERRSLPGLPEFWERPDDELSTTSSYASMP